MGKIYQLFQKNKVIVLGILVGLVFVGYLVINKRPTNNEPVKTQVLADKKSASKEEIKSAEKTIVVDVQGAVNKPGVYHLKERTIVLDALQMAGGTKNDADLKQINQAKRLKDQMQIYVPNKTEKRSTGSGSAEKEAVNINTATVDDFKKVTGVGPKKAEKIIAFREQHGDFKDLNDLKKVSGFGEKTIEKLKDQLTV
ncbi:competence protein ComEA [Companilactobacillus suantsaicola]|uniref:Competence protein ComEA n=1 Tax=Companilactobacillus suantsaicola TaxID=2487723 RepID=A0A4Z0JTE4_9LACO|nr:helix-hairpin-helix domain-containing protein [Companilactobacillus suantsaicola]TGD25357.1 competence protein ComEA [Companilactobacillus suantsaicola]